MEKRLAFVCIKKPTESGKLSVGRYYISRKAPQAEHFAADLSFLVPQ